MFSRNQYVSLLTITILIIILFFFNLFYGSVSIPVSVVSDIILGKAGYEYFAWKNIILQLRLPQAIAALLSGAALSVVGLMLQILFQNSLAGPDVLGINSGANLGVALILLYCKRIDVNFSLGFSLSTVTAAFIGALVVLVLILYFSIKLKDHTIILIVGVMVSYLVSSVIFVLNSLAPSENIRSYVLWGLGNFSNISLSEIPFFSVSILIGLLFTFFLIKPLNALLLGECYATNLGFNIKKLRVLIFIVSGFLIAIVTAFCGPISLIGLIVPCIAKIILKKSNYQLLLPLTILLGSFITLFCNLMTTIPFWNNLIPLNTIIQLLTIPSIIYIIWNKKIHI